MGNSVAVDVRRQAVQAAPKAEAARRRGLVFERHFTRDLKKGQTPYDTVQWERRTAVITDAQGNTVFEQNDVEMPTKWSQTATNIVASKYFHGTVGSKARERSLSQLVHRVVDTVANWGASGGYFRSGEDVESFRDDLAHLMLAQNASFNSPVWFNVGVLKESRGYGWAWSHETGRATALNPDEHRPQCSACFINSVEDSLESILDLVKTEGMLFKWGSGTGTNLSKIREDDAGLAGGGRASGPVSFMKGFDAFAGVIKSGGKTRRAAKMVILNIDHPDVKEFVWCKAREEGKAHVLIENGYDGAIDGDAYSTISFQNANNSVRVSDEFMQAAEQDGDWWTRSVLSQQPKERHRARELLREIAEATHQCGDPGMQFDSTINKWNPVKATARIDASNPCSEYMFLNDSACNLASLNLKSFRGRNGGFDVVSFRRAVRTLILAQEILVDNAAYPTARIAENSHNYRPLGLGFANLGALLMSLGVPYDSDRGRAIAGAITSVMCGQAYVTSAEIAEVKGAFAGFERNRECFLEVIGMHRSASREIDRDGVQSELREDAERVWDEALARGRVAGYRNGQVTVIAPTGTIGFMMDCDTTGIEPELALVKYKKLVGGGRDQDCEQHRVRSPVADRIQRGPGEPDRQPHRVDRDDRGRRGSPERASSDLRLQLQGAERRAHDSLHRAPEDDVGSPALRFRRDLQDDQHAGRVHRGRDRRRVHGGMAAWLEGGGDLQGRLQGRAAAEHRQCGEREESGGQVRAGGPAASTEAP